MVRKFNLGVGFFFFPPYGRLVRNLKLYARLEGKLARLVCLFFVCVCVCMCVFSTLLIFLPIIEHN